MVDFARHDELTERITHAWRVQLAGMWWRHWSHLCDADEHGINHNDALMMYLLNWTILGELVIDGHIGQEERWRLATDCTPQTGDVVDVHEFDNPIWSLVVEAGWLRS